MRTKFLDLHLNKFKFYRRLTGGIWYKHSNTYQLSGLVFDYFWARYGEINRYTKVKEIENYEDIK